MHASAGVDDVLYDYDVLVPQRLVQILHYLYHSTGLGLVSVAGNPHEIKVYGDRYPLRQLAGTETGAFKDADNGYLFPCVVPANKTSILSIEHLPFSLTVRLRQALLPQGTAILPVLSRFLRSP